MAIDPVPALDGIFSHGDAVAAGLTHRQLERNYIRLLPGRWIRNTTPVTQHLIRQAALSLAPRGALLCHATAAELHGGVVPQTSSIHVGILQGQRVRTGGITAHHYEVLPKTVVVQGLPVTSTQQTFVDLARCLPLVDAVVLGDSFVRRDHSALEQLLTLAREARGRGSRTAIRAAELLRVGAESPYETRIRLLMALAGLPEPVLQHLVRDARGRIVYRLDLAYPHCRVAVEYDGAHHATAAQRSVDHQRREDLESVGWRVVVATASDIHSRPELLLTRIRNALRLAGGRLTLPSEEWRLHFRPAL
ncbi:endonuclease domain-containing protein [Rudaeicoccus suwonensis]|uniref:Very-short-patch-repair endonuclease n=1 Tax=Rudaeicoccus suwonensis TaxID=657409 RepID=A0A561E2W7_9MICO|nr:DUF559 domain-containing protein [Rudaeicoccus suwonensis]TWE09956.1 very-short-patch-repair endonuclease [Rudaeicoccus suwonensis]